MRIALAQLNFRINDFAGNLARIQRALNDVPDADLVVCSELALSGYYPQDLMEEPEFYAQQARSIDALREWSRHVATTLVVGAVTLNEGPGKMFHNSLLVLRGGKVVATYHKQLLPDGGVFDERRHFEPGPATPVMVNVAGTNVGFVICEDAWNPEGKAYAVDPVAQAMGPNLDLLVSINASPSNVGKTAERHATLARQAKKHWVPIAYVNQVGGNDALVFDGGSFLMQPGGETLVTAPLFSEAVMQADFAQGQFTPLGDGWTPGTPTLEAPEIYYRQIICGIRDYMAKTGFTTVVVGSSGGIDSAVVLALAADAVGAANVTAITMPSPYSSAGSVDDSVTLCENLGVRLFRHPISPLFNEFNGAFDKAFGEPPKGLTLENVQARIRGVVLMEYSNQYGALLLTTGNKSEVSVGYSTLYGDMNGGLNPIGDLYKREVYALAEYINWFNGYDVIPAAIIYKAPSAELAEGQRDDDSLPPYPVLDAILKWHIEGVRLCPREYEEVSGIVEDLQATGQGHLVERVIRLVAGAEFKRRQAAPIIRVRQRAFGSGRQVPITAKVT